MLFDFLGNFGFSIAFLAIFASLAVAMFFALFCAVCKRNQDDGQPQLKGMSHKLDNIVENGILSNNNHMPGHVMRHHESGDFAAAKAKATTINRKLPEIPNGSYHPNTTYEDPSNLDTGSDLYETLPNNGGTMERLEADIRTSENAKIRNGSSTDKATLSIAATKREEFRQNSPSSSNQSETENSLKDDLTLPHKEVTTKEHHPYAKVKHKRASSASAVGAEKGGGAKGIKRENVYAVIQGQMSEERDTDTDNYDDPQILRKNSCSWSAFDLPPPIPEKRFDPSEVFPSPPYVSTPASVSSNQALASCSSANRSHSSLHLENLAASAVAGHLSSAEIPYMTSPFGTPDGGLIEDSNNSSAGSVIGRYTCISVREPLANLMAQATGIVLHQQGSTSTESADKRVGRRPENHYSLLSDDEQNMYAEIGSGQHSAASSITYARVQPVGGVSVAPNHDVIGEERSNSRLEGQEEAGNAPEPPTVESLLTTAMSQHRHSSSQNLALQTDTHSIHQPSPKAPLTPSESNAQRADPDTFAARPNSTPVIDSDIDQMYAKVLKNKARSSIPLHGGIDQVDNGGFAYLRLGRKEESVETSTERLVISEETSQWISEIKKHPQHLTKDAPDQAELNCNSSDFGYERITETRPGRSQLIVTDPGYETVPNCGPPSSIADPDYEMLRGDYDDESEAGYERVRRKKSVRSAAAESDIETDPMYEVVSERRKPNRAKIAEEDEEVIVDVGYETVKPKAKPERDRLSSEESETDSYYEKITKRTSVESGKSGSANR